MLLGNLIRDNLILHSEENTEAVNVSGVTFFIDVIIFLAWVLILLSPCRVIFSILFCPQTIINTSKQV